MIPCAGDGGGARLSMPWAADCVPATSAIFGWPESKRAAYQAAHAVRIMMAFRGTRSAMIRTPQIRVRSFWRMRLDRPTQPKFDGEQMPASKYVHSHCQPVVGPSQPCSDPSFTEPSKQQQVAMNVYGSTGGLLDTMRSTAFAIRSRRDQR